ncbi:MAG: aerobic C4-dicarboxylate transport protein [Alphaproteobacteria bacterium]|jgi:aerobic C4-dicarboxylate transport protein|nr:aerobic C4-dicarboxylate transport protein [Alphaproteobacteria bacterium]
MTAETTNFAVKRRRPIYRDLSVQILIAMALGILVGSVWPSSADALRPLGDLFIKLVRMLVAPIIFCTVVHGIASVREAKRVGRVALKALIYFEIVTTLALIVALVLVNLWAPGANMHVDPASLSDKSVAAVEASAQHANFGEFLLDIVPSSAVGAFADGDVLPVLFISILFAFALSAIGAKAAPVVEAIGTASQIIFKMIGYVMVIAPIGAFGAIAFSVGKFGPSTLFALGELVAEFYVCCAIFVVLVFWPIAYWTGLSFIRLIRYFAAELLIVVGTNSGETVFPRLNAKLRTLGCDESVVALVLPTGYAFNHDGTCLYFATVSIFLAQAVGIDLTLSQQLGLLAIMLITSKGGAGVAGSAIVMLASTLAATGTIPVAAVGLVLGVHRLLSSAFVPVNVLGNALATIVVARFEGAVNMPALNAELHREAIA